MHRSETEVPSLVGKHHISRTDIYSESQHCSNSVDRNFCKNVVSHQKERLASSTTRLVDVTAVTLRNQEHTRRHPTTPLLPGIVLNAERKTVDDA